MNQYQYQEYFNRNNFLKRTLQLVFSISIVSCILCYSSGFSLFPHSFNVYFSTFLFSFLTHTLERKYMFLICNGILVFLAKSSISYSSSSAYVGGEISPVASELPEMKASADVDEEVVMARTESNSLENVAVVAEEERVEGSLSREEEQENEASIGENEDKEEAKGSVIVQEEDNAEVEADEEEDTPISTEELNRRIEEFIRKMKEEIRIEAQQQLIAV